MPVANGHVLIIVALELNFRLQVIHCFGFEMLYADWFLLSGLVKPSSCFLEKKEKKRLFKAPAGWSNFGIFSIPTVLLPAREHHRAQEFTFLTTPLVVLFLVPTDQLHSMTSQVEGGGDLLRPWKPWFDESPGPGPKPASPLLTPPLYFSTFLLKWITSAGGEQTRRSISISDPFSRNCSHAILPPRNPQPRPEVQTDWSATMNLLKSTLEYTRQTMRVFFPSCSFLPPSVLCGSCCC